MRPPSKSLLSSLFFATVFVCSSAAAQEGRNGGSYCLAIRGNGELMPAHWGALARIVESYELPSAMAGGSSASMSMFLLEAMASNPHLGKDNQSQAVSLFFKSLPAYFAYLSTLEKFKPLVRLLKDPKRVRSEARRLGLFLAINPIPKLEDYNGDYALYKKDVLDLIQKLGERYERFVKIPELQILTNKKFLAYIKSLKGYAEKISVSKNQEESNRLMAQALFRVEQIKIAIKEFGSFNAKEDRMIYFRENPVGFEGLSELFSRIADFYAGNRFSEADIAAQNSFLGSCLLKSKGQSWQEFALEETENNCHSRFIAWLDAYRSRLDLPPDGESGSSWEPLQWTKKAGATIASFAATTVVQNAGVKVFENAIQSFLSATSTDFLKNFQLKSSEIGFGYWGPSHRALENVQENLKELFPDDLKSQKFVAISPSSWKSILQSSPAEPGLSPIKRIPVSPFNDEVDIAWLESHYSAGGWGDLAPVQILKAHGCEKVLYLTRRGGESFFAQEVAQSLMNLSGIPDEILARDSAANANGISSDQSSEWSRLYNLANPKSSFNTALKNSAAVYCSDWNSLDAKKDGLFKLFDEGYQAPLFFNGESMKREINSIEQSDNVFLEDKGHKLYAGCIPN